MGKRGPAPDPAQAAKGFPGRRKTKATRAAEHAARIAGMLAPAPASLVDLPPMLQEPKYAPAAQVWRRLAPELRRTYRLPVESEFYFIQLCVYAQEWVEQTDDLHTKGFAQSVETVAGGKMERRRPMIHDRQQAFSNCMELSARFGLTPTDMYALFKDQKLAVERNPDMFGNAPQPAAPSGEDGARTTRVGGMSGMRSTPPGESLN